MAAVFFKMNSLSGARNRFMTVHRYWPECFHAQHYLDIHETYGKVRVPQAYAGPFRGDPEDITLPPAQTHKKPGRPKKKRYKYGRQTKKTIMERFPDLVAPHFEVLLEDM